MDALRSSNLHAELEAACRKQVTASFAHSTMSCGGKGHLAKECSTPAGIVEGGKGIERRESGHAGAADRSLPSNGDGES